MGRFQRAAGVLILAAAIGGAALLWWSVSDVAGPRGDQQIRGVALGTWNLLYQAEAPTLGALAGAAGLALVAAGAVAMIEWRIITRARRSSDPLHRPLAPKVVMAETRGTFAGPITITVLIPAHNEADCIGATIRSLLQQSRRPDHIIVVADNCTDATTDIAAALGAEVLETVGNRFKKAGAINQALGTVLPQQRENDLVMVMDADTTLDDGFLASVDRRMADDRALMAIGGLFYGDEGGGMLGQFQRNEYHRYSRELQRRRGKVFVLTGTASVFRPRALRTIAELRGTGLPGSPGDVYDPLAITEDNEITLALKSLGGLTLSPSDCTVVTEVMPTWRALWGQRLRWQRGAVENLGSYGLTPHTFRYWMQQLGIGYGVIALASYLTMMLLLIISFDAWIWFPFWLSIGTIFVVERVVTVWDGGWQARLLAVTIFPELAYAAFLDVVYVKGIIDISLGRRPSWGIGDRTPLGMTASA